MKPILFNTEMVRAILEDRKTVTRRVVKPQPYGKLVPMPNSSCWPGYFAEEGTPRVVPPPYRPGDILYVREMWTVWDGNYEYKADVDSGYGPFCSSCTLDICAGGCNSVLKWRPSIHMPREAARIFLRVKNVQVERLQEISAVGIEREGVRLYDDICHDESWHPSFYDPDSGGTPSLITGFSKLWDSTLKPADRALYGWAANPWVWVIEFERCERPEEMH